MFIKRLLNLAAVMTFLLSVAGCGSGNSNTNGTLTLTATAPTNGAGAADLTASATVTPVSTGAKVNFVANQYGYDSTTGAYLLIETYTNSPSTDKNGLATMTAHAFQQSTTMATAIQVSATCGGLSKSVTISVPKYVP
jgi:hypothetical protein